MKKRYIISKDDYHFLQEGKTFFDAEKILASDKVITDQNLSFKNLNFLSVLLSEEEVQDLTNKKVKLSEDNKEQIQRNVPLGRLTGNFNSSFNPNNYTPSLGDYPFYDIGFQKYDNKNITGRNIKIGLLDTGINVSAPDLVVNSGVNYTSASPTYEDVYLHGTYTTSIIKHKNFGLAPDAYIRMIKIVDDSGNLTQSVFLTGVSDAISNNLDILNISFHFTPSDNAVVQSAINSLLAANCLPVVAGGNGSYTDPVRFPACCFGAIGVGASTTNLQLASLTNCQIPATWKGLDILAPGESVPYTTSIRGNGTSFSAPYVVSVLACIMEDNKCNSKKAWHIMRSNARKTSDPLLGYGFLNC